MIWKTGRPSRTVCIICNERDFTWWKLSALLLNGGGYRFFFYQTNHGDHSRSTQTNESDQCMRLVKSWREEPPVYLVFIFNLNSYAQRVSGIFVLSSDANLPRVCQTNVCKAATKSPKSGSGKPWQRRTEQGHILLLVFQKVKDKNVNFSNK